MTLDDCPIAVIADHVQQLGGVLPGDLFVSGVHIVASGRTGRAVVDFADCAYVSSAGLRAVLIAAKTANMRIP